MSLRKVMPFLFVLLLLTAQFLAAQHASVHPIEATGIHQTSHASADHHHDGDEEGGACGLCAMLHAMGQAVTTPPVALILVALLLAFVPLFTLKTVKPLGIAAHYQAQAPPVLFR